MYSTLTKLIDKLEVLPPSSVGGRRVTRSRARV